MEKKKKDLPLQENFSPLQPMTPMWLPIHVAGRTVSQRKEGSAPSVFCDMTCLPVLSQLGI